VSAFRRFGRFFGDYFDRERWWVLTPLRHVPYPPYVADGERPSVRIRVDWAGLGGWAALVFCLGILAFPLVLIGWLVFW
jgi:hypothetical protein